jgi:hypothetical protein
LAASTETPVSVPAHVAITTVPSGARVFVDDEVEPRGTTPYSLELEKAGGKVTLRLVRAGYITKTKIVDRIDGALELSLEKQKRTAGPPPVHAVTETPAPMPTPVAAPNSGDSDDTMDPFTKKR